MHFQTFETADLACLKDFEPPKWGDLVPRFEYFLQSPVCHPIKMLADNKTVAIGTSILHDDTAWLACIVVLEHYRNQGFGKYITQQLIDNIDANIVSTIYLDATDLGYPVYKKLGFQVDTEYAHIHPPNAYQQTPVSDKLTPFAPNFADQLFALDQQVSGEKRHVMLSEHLDAAQLYVDQTRIEGFYMPSLAEGLIVANTPHAGICLLKHRLQTHNAAAFPINNTSALQFFEQQNCHITRYSKRMFLGEKRTWQPQNLYNRISGQLG